ncbi:MAG TPA: hypothetical protein DDY98_09005 [Ruminococcaceae bacterium]|nr:hypothetical protein [Oscillospiraceae bacterium]
MAYTRFKGTYTHGLDAKKRMFIPAKYREPLGTNFVICRAPIPNVSIYVFPEETWDELCDELNTKNAQGELTHEQEWERRNLYRYSEDVIMDKQGRITISPQMCAYAGLKDEVLIIGNMKRLEIWDPETFERIEQETLHGEAVGTPKLNF